MRFQNREYLHFVEQILGLSYNSHYKLFLNKYITEQCKLLYNIPLPSLVIDNISKYYVSTLRDKINVNSFRFINWILDEVCDMKNEMNINISNGDNDTSNTHTQEELANVRETEFMNLFLNRNDYTHMDYCYQSSFIGYYDDDILLKEYYKNMSLLFDFLTSVDFNKLYQFNLVLVDEYKKHIKDEKNTTEEYISNYKTYDLFIDGEVNTCKPVLYMVIRKESALTYLENGETHFNNKYFITVIGFNVKDSDTDFDAYEFIELVFT